MSVIREIKDVGPWRKELSVEVPVEAVDAEMERVTEAMRKRAKAPGFRKGKVPLNLVRKQYMEEIRQETLERILPRFWRQAEAEAQLDALVAPRLGEVEWTDDAFVFAATVEVRPEISITSVEGFQLPEVDTEPTAEEVDEALEDLRKQVSDWKPVERPAAEGDMVTVKILEGAGPQDQGEDPRPVMLEIGEDTVWPELSQALTGLEIGNTATFTRPGDESGEGPIVRRFSVELLEVKERLMPELDDALAQQLGDFEDLAALRTRVTEQLRVGKENEASGQREEAMLGQLAERHPFQVPEGALEVEVQEMLNEYGQALAEQGVDIENADIEWQKIAEEFAPRAEGRVRSRLLLDAVADHLDLSEDAEELEAALGTLARQRKVSTVAMRKSLADSGRLESLRRHLRRRAVVRHLLGEESPFKQADAEPVAANEGPVPKAEEPLPLSEPTGEEEE